jgi:DNA uptake protein ComE-like DNA-binding protein
MKYLSGLFTILLTATLISCGGSEQAEQESSSTMEDTVSTEQTISAAAPEAKLNINNASGEAFRTIPGVGDKMVHEFEEYRPYVSILQFRKEIGKYVDEEQVAAYEKYIYVPVSPNESDAASLQQLPGIDADKAQQLVDGRPYDSADAFIEELTSHVNEEQIATAKTYLKSE